MSTIRALGAGGRWAARGEEAVERWQRAALCAGGAAQWLALRLQATAAAVLAAAAALAVLQRATHAADPGMNMGILTRTCGLIFTCVALTRT